MNDIAICVENLSKRYRIGGPQARYKTIRETMTDLAVAPFRRLRRLGQPLPPEETIWALKDVSFEVKQGEVVGIIGRNGAGKTTLLKVLTRITEPTEGYAEIHGRVGSLLEVGTGFHPELTGRENIYLNGAILGMKRAEIDGRFDEIVEFAEIEKFLDTPVKRYSSGMYVRLAFAVAAHLEPEILLVDEVLSVGDAAFQKKCLGKMEGVASEGRTVLFVSHNMGAIQSLCGRTLLLADGHLALDGATSQVVETYLSSEQEIGSENVSLDAVKRRNGLGDLIRFNKCLVLDSNGKETTRLLFGEPFRVYVEAMAKAELQDLSVVIGFDSFLDHRIVTVASEDNNEFFCGSPSRHLRICAEFGELKLTPGVYWLTIGVRSGKVGLDHLPHVLKLAVLEAADEHCRPHSGTWGFVHTLARWNNIDDG